MSRLRSRSPDPLHCLPYEAWVRSIQHYAFEQPEGPLPLLDISRSWQKNIFSTPEIWTTIYLDGGNDEECRAECFFHLARLLLVDLVIGKNSAAVETALKYRNRIRSLTFRPKRSETFSTSDISRFSSKLEVCTYPHLTYMCVDSQGKEIVVIPKSLLQACPALIGIHGAYIGQETTPYLLPSTTTCEVLGDGSGLVNELEDLRLRFVPSQRENLDDSDHFRIPSTRLKHLELITQRHKINFSQSLDDRDTIFSDTAYYLHLFREFASSTHHALKVLIMTMPWYEFTRLIPCLSACKALRELALHLDFSVDSSQLWNGSAITVTEIGHIKKVSMLTMSKIWSGINFASNESRNERLFIRSLAEYGALQHLEELRLALDSPLAQGSPILDLLRTTKKIKKLNLKGCTVARPYDSEKVVLSHLHTLIIDRGSHLEYLEPPQLACVIAGYLEDTPRTASSVFSRGKLASLTTSSPSFFRWNDFFMTETINKKPLEGLLTLSLLAGNFLATPTYRLNLSNLRSISFEEYNETPRSTEKLIGKSSLNHFMLEILFSPSNCPRLHTIRGKRYPNWALAIAMFHRRNVIKTVTPITSLWLPGHPQATILMKLVDAMKAADASPERSVLAAAWIDRVIKHRWDISFFRKQACQHCIMCGYVKCSSDSLQFQFYRPDPPNDDPNVTAMLDLEPTKVETSTLSSLNMDEWKCHLQEAICVHDPLLDSTKNSRCHRHSKWNMVRIGRDTLDGTTCDAF